jgi:hypothetical protein
MNHKKWTAQEGAPQGINALAQAPDGVLWVGSDSGLYSFGGRTFTEFQARPGEQDLPAGRVESILISRDGDLWVGFRSNGVARLSHGRVTLFDPAGQPPLTLVQHIRQSSDGAICALDRQRRIVRFGGDGNWHQKPTPLGEQGGRIRNIFIDASNTLWIDQGGRLYRQPLSQGQDFATGTEADWVFGYAEASDHSLWVTDVTTSTPEGQSGRIRHIDPDGNVLARNLDAGRAAEADVRASDRVNLANRVTKPGGPGKEPDGVGAPEAEPALIREEVNSRESGGLKSATAAHPGVRILR